MKTCNFSVEYPIGKKKNKKKKQFIPPPLFYLRNGTHLIAWRGKAPCWRNAGTTTKLYEDHQMVLMFYLKINHFPITVLALTLIFVVN